MESQIERRHLTGGLPPLLPAPSARRPWEPGAVRGDASFFLEYETASLWRVQSWQELTLTGEVHVN
jgi:hypothetical protein